MALGFVVVLERELADIDPRGFDGGVLAKHRHTLDAMAHEEDLPGLGEFVAFSAEEAETLAADMKFDVPPASSGRWFECSKALQVVDAVRSHLADNPDELEDVTAVLDGLDGLRSILDRAGAAGTRFRLSLDY